MGVWQRLGESNGTKGTAMARVSTPGITLSSTERAALEQLVRKRSPPQQLVTRAKLLLAAAQGKGYGRLRGSSIWPGIWYNAGAVAG